MEESGGETTTAQPRSPSIQPNERLLLHVHDFALASRLLNVRVYQVLHTTSRSSSSSSSTSVDYVGYRIAASDDVENDYALFVSRIKGEQIHRSSTETAGTNASTQALPEAIASCLLAQLDIIGNRHRDVGRLVCKEPLVAVGRKPRTVPPRWTLPGSSKNSHRPPKAQDKRANRNKLSQQRMMQQIAAAHDGSSTSGDSSAVDPTADHGQSPTESPGKGKSRKSSEASLLHRMANASATTVWRAELEGIDDELDELHNDEDDEDDDDEESASASSSPTRAHAAKVASTSPSSTQYRRSLPERKTKYKSLQERRDKERYQRLHMSQSEHGEASRSPPRSTLPSRQSNCGSGSPPRSRQASIAKPPAMPAAGASAAIGNAYALKTFQTPEQEQFLRRKTIRLDEKRVLKTEGVFNEALGVEITTERPPRRPGSAASEKDTNEDDEQQMRRPSSRLVRRSIAAKAQHRPAEIEDGESVKVSPRPEEMIENNEADGSADVGEGVKEATGGGVELVEEHPFVDENAAELVQEGRYQMHAATDEQEEEDATPSEALAINCEELIPEVETLTDTPFLVEEPLQSETSLRSPRLVSPRQQIIEIEETEGEDTLVKQQQDELDMSMADEAMKDDGVGAPTSPRDAEPPVLPPRTECWEEPEQEANLGPAYEPLNTEVAQPIVSQEEVVPPNPEATPAWATPVQEPPVEDTVAAASDDSFFSIAESATLPTVAEAENPKVEIVEAPKVEIVEAPKVEIVEAPTPPMMEPPMQIAVEATESPAVAVSPPQRKPRRGSITEVHASAIAAAAAAAAVTAVATTPTDSSPLQKHSPKPEPGKGKISSHKRRSHDATAAIGGLRNQGNRRSTLHITTMSQHPLPKQGYATSSQVTENSTLTPHPEQQVRPQEQTVETPPAKTPQRHSPAGIEALHKSPSYHAKWRPWMNGRVLIEKVGCLQLEELVLSDPTNGQNLVRLGLRYARQPTTSLAAALLLEHAAVIHHEPTHTHEYWHALGSAHFDVFLRHRKYLPIARFHLVQSLQAFSRALAFLPSLADPLLLLRYAVGLFWHKTESHLEHADEIVDQLLTRFTAFCDRDRPHLLRFHLQVLVRLRRFTEAINHLQTIISIYDQAQRPVSGTDSDGEYTLQDDLLLMVFCQQSRGDFLHASTTLARALGPNVNASLLDDNDYVKLWGSVADKCFAHEDYGVAIELYAVAASHAKDSRMLAQLAYAHALCYQALGEETKCTAEYKRARNFHRQVVPLATLAELHAKYEDQYFKLRHTPVPQLVADVQATLHDRVVTALQRIFRRRQKDAQRHLQNSGRGSAGARPAPPRQPSISKLGDMQRMSVALSLAPTDTGDEEIPDALEDSQPEDPHAAFIRRRCEAMHALQSLRDKHTLAKTRSFHTTGSTSGNPQSGLLSPLRDRPDLQRKHSMDAVVKQLGYIPASKAKYVDHWQAMVTKAMDLYESRSTLFRHVHQIRATVPLVTEAVACCALADALGDADTASERLQDATYERELQLVCDAVDVMAVVHRRDSESTTKFPPIRSPKSPPLKMTSPVNKPPATASPLPAVKTVRLTSLIDTELKSTMRPEKAKAVEADKDTGGSIQEAYNLNVLDDFRSVNASRLDGWQR